MCDPSLTLAEAEAEVEPQELNNIIEAALLAARQPLDLPMLKALFPEEEGVAQDDIVRALAALQAACAGRGVELAEVGSGFRYQVRAAVHPWVARLWTERQIKYSRALLETLALIAYRQPITRGEIEQVRGVTVASSIMHTLEEREWVRVVGYRDVPGKPALFGTTRQFLDYFNLKSLDQLPTLAEIRDIADPDPQLALAAGIGIAAQDSVDGTAEPAPQDPGDPPPSPTASPPPGAAAAESDARNTSTRTTEDAA